jgi:NADPH:quinone reductase-like Zn-dependent oxidoreductase
MGAHHVVEHDESLVDRVRECIPGDVDFVLSTQSTAQHLAAYAELLKPYGAIVVLDEPAALDTLILKPKSISLYWHSVFTDQLFEPSNLTTGGVLTAIGRLVDAGRVRSTLSEQVGPIDAATVREAHRRVERGETVGKLALVGFDG